MKKVSGGNAKGMIGAAIGLFSFSCGYALFVKRLGDLHKGYTWVLVVVGNTVVLLAAAPFIGWKNVMKLFLFFAAAGIPMSLGDIVKGVNALRNAEYTAQRIISGAADRGLKAAGSKHVHTNQAPTA